MSRSAQRPPSILLVDDDQLITSSLQGLLSLETDYEVTVLNDPAEAVKQAQRRPFDLILTDFLMPKLNGVEMLKRIREVQPDAVRMLLTGFADKENAIRAINEVGLYHYLEKPWDNDNLLLLIRNALEERSLRAKLRKKVQELEGLIREHSSLTNRHESLERELERAAQVQQGLLPKELPAPNGYRVTAHSQPSTMLGGDFYDVCERDGATVWMLADVSGHGTHSALSSMLLKAIFHEAVRESEDPAQALAGMNRRLFRFLPDGMYACATLLWRDQENPVLQLANAGLPRPFLLRASANRVDEVPITGMPLGLFGEALPGAHDLREIELGEGDAVVLLTDGLGDVRNQRDQFLQDGLLLQTLEELCGHDPECIKRKLFERAREFADGRGFPDDISLLILAREPADRRFPSMSPTGSTRLPA